MNQKGKDFQNTLQNILSILKLSVYQQMENDSKIMNQPPTSKTTPKAKTKQRPLTFKPITFSPKYF